MTELELIDRRIGLKWQLVELTIKEIAEMEEKKKKLEGMKAKEAA